MAPPNVLGIPVPPVRSNPCAVPCDALKAEEEHRVRAQLEIVSMLENQRQATARVQEHLQRLESAQQATAKKATSSAWWSSATVGAVLVAIVTGVFTLLQAGVQAKIQKSSEAAVENRDKTVERRLADERAKAAEQRREDIREAIRAANAERDRLMIVK